MTKLILPLGVALAMVAVEAHAQSDNQTPNGEYTQAPSAANWSANHRASQQQPSNGPPDGEYTQARSAANQSPNRQQPSQTPEGEYTQAYSAENRNANMSNAKMRLSNQVGDLLNSTNEARLELESGNRQDAQFHIDHALQKANMIRSTSPKQRFVQFYDEVNSYAVLAPIMTHRTAGQSAANAAPVRDSDASHIANSSAQDVAVREAAGQFTSAALDVQGADDHLIAAKQALQAGNDQKADEALRAVQDGVVVASIETDLPLLRARENLMLARESAQNGNFAETHAALEGASRALGNYVNSSGEHANDARMLRSQIDHFNESVQQNRNGAVQTIDEWWDQTAGWMTPPKES